MNGGSGFHTTQLHRLSTWSRSCARTGRDFEARLSQGQSLISAVAMAMSPFQYDYFVRSAEVMYESGQYEAARAALLTAKGIGGDGSADTGLEAVDAKLAQASRAKR